MSLASNILTPPTMPAVDATKYLQSKVDVLTASIETIDFELKMRKNFLPSIQLKIYRERRAYLNGELSNYKKLLKNEKRNG